MLSRKGMNADIELFLSGLEKHNNNNQSKKKKKDVITTTSKKKKKMSIITTTSPKNKKHDNNNQSKVFSPICTHSWGEESHNSQRNNSIDF